MSDSEWHDARVQAFGYRLCELAMDESNERGEPITDDTLLILFNASAEPVDFVLPDAHPGKLWELLVDTAREEEPENLVRLNVGSKIEMTGRSAMVLRADQRGE